MLLKCCELRTKNVIYRKTSRITFASLNLFSFFSGFSMFEFHFLNFTGFLNFNRKNSNKMNFLTRVSFSRANLAKINAFPLVSLSALRQLSISAALRKENSENPEESEEKVEEKIDPAIDRTKIIPVETSIRYLKSTAYTTTYGQQPVWVQYRRNFKGQFPPLKTRKTCVRAGKISTGNPCPICRDEYLVLDHNNVDLLKQFISKHTGEVSVTKLQRVH